MPTIIGSVMTWVAFQIDTLRELLPILDVNVPDLGGRSAEVLIPVDEGGFRGASKSPLEVIADLIINVNDWIPVDQFLLALGFVGAVYLVLHGFRAIRWVIQLIRGSGS